MRWFTISITRPSTAPIAIAMRAVKCSVLKPWVRISATLLQICAPGIGICSLVKRLMLP